MLAQELGGIQRVMLVHAKSALVGTIRREVLEFIATFRQLKHIYPDPRWAVDDVSIPIISNLGSTSTRGEDAEESELTGVFPGRSIYIYALCLDVNQD